MRKFLLWSSGTSPALAGSWIILIRLYVGLIFILAAVRKFLEPEDMGPGRFEGLGFPAPAFFSYWVGSWELIGGALVLIGLLTRAAAIPLAVTMICALLITKVPRFGGEQTVVEILHASRLDTALLLSSLFLMAAGGGRFAVDRMVGRAATSMP